MIENLCFTFLHIPFNICEFEDLLSLAVKILQYTIRRRRGSRPQSLHIKPESWDSSVNQAATVSSYSYSQS
jgi:hypothetical protein